MNFIVQKILCRNKKEEWIESLGMMQLYCKICREIIQTSRKCDRIKVRYERFV